MGYSEFEVKLATELLMSDAVGFMIQGKVGIKDTFASLRRKAARANVSLNTPTFGVLIRYCRQLNQALDCIYCKEDP